MPFTIKIAVNSRDVVHIRCCNCGSPTGDREVPTRIYHYEAKNLENGKVTTGKIIHERTAGIEALSSLILMDLSKKENSFEPPV